MADYAAEADEERAAAWIAELDDARVGCVFCVPGDDPRTVRLRLLLVHPDGHGLGLGARLVDTAIEFGREAGYERMRLWTNDPLSAARRIYLSRGFALERQEPHRSVGFDLIRQTHALELAPARGRVRHARL